MEKKFFQRLIPMLLVFGLIIASLGLFGCGSASTSPTEGDGGSNDGTSETGELVISLTDAAGDFLSYTVDVLSLTLTKANGAVVNTLPLTTRVDFAQYTEMTEFLTASTVPCGVYTKATLVLDYQNADIWVQDSNGNSVQVNTIQDENGDPITTLAVSVHLEDTKSLHIAPGIPAHLTLDFDLSASNSVEFDDNGSPILTVEPTLQADLDPEAPKIHRVRGPLKEVDIDDSSFRVIIRPFCHHLRGNDERFGTLKVTTDDNTVYDINGQMYKGRDGLLAMDELTPLTAVVAIGDLKFRPYRFEAREVRAGSSVPGGTMDVVTGNVISRDGDTITVKGATLIRDDGSSIFNDRVTVQLGEDTVVSRQLSIDTFDIGDISVGQRIMVFGTLTNSDVSQLEMDATEGYARMLLTTLRGTVVETYPSDMTAQLVVDLRSIDVRRIGIFDFRGTGVDTENDADPVNYQINTSTLDISSLSSNTPVKVRGFVRPFGEAPADFSAHTIISVSNMKSFMKVKWHPPATDAFESLSAEEMVLNMERATLFHHVGRGRVVIDLKDLSETPSIRPKEGGQGIYLIIWRGTVQLHTTFENFVNDLAERMADSRAVNKIFATGSFDDETATLTADFIQVKLQ